MSNPVDVGHPGSHAAIVGHLCHQPGCGHWGAWGYDGGSGISAWWCLEHRPDTDPVEPVAPQGDWVSDGNEG